MPQGLIWYYMDMNEAPEFYAPDRASWRAWLQKNHLTEKSVWLVFDKGKNRTLPWAEIVDEALCFGWVDGRANKVSDTRSKIYVSRRKPKSTWSKINKTKVEELIQSSKMQPAGLAAIEIAKANGAWDQLNLSDDLVLPTELIKLLNANQSAKINFDTFPNSTKRVILEWIYTAKTNETKLSRIQKTVELAAQNIRAR